MNCPFCGAQMDYGHLAAAGYRIIWTQRAQKWTSLPGDDDIMLQKASVIGKNRTHAWRCARCRKIIVDY